MTAPALRRITPAAYQLLPADAPEHEWLAARRNGIGSSDIAKIVGVADRQQAAHVYHDKIGALSDDAGEAALFGKLLEPVVAQEWQRRNKSVVHRVGLVANADEPWMMCTLDRLVRVCPLDPATKARCALEVKCRSAFKADKWHAQVPDDVLAQAMWQLIVTGLDHIHVAVLIGGNDYRQAVVRRDEKLIAFLIGEARRFWHGNVLARIEPEWDYDTDHPDDLIDLDRRLHPIKEVAELTVADIGAVIEYAELSAAASAAEKARKAASARLLHLAAGHRFVKFGNELAYRYGQSHKAKCDFALLAEKHPDAYAECVSQTVIETVYIDKAYKKGKA